MATDHYLEIYNTGVLSSLGHVLVRLTVGNRRWLLSEASRVSLSRSAEARSISARLSQLNPEVGRLFQPKGDVLSRLDLRMILTNITESIKSSIPRPLEAPDATATTPTTTALPARANPKVSSYIVVSYAWHNPDWQPVAAATPIVSGWGISRPMVDAVLVCREYDREGVWIDRLCINQDDEHDRAMHVGAMDVIYRSARRMVILLEDVQLDEDEAFAALLYKRWYQDMCVAVTEHNLEGAAKKEFIEGFVAGRDGDYWNRERLAAESKDRDPSSSNISFARLVAGRRSFIIKMLKARWFSRAWCAHESRVRPHEQWDNPLMLCFGPDGVVLSFEFCFVHWLPSHITSISNDAERILMFTSGVAKAVAHAKGGGRNRNNMNRADRALTKAVVRDAERNRQGLETLNEVIEITKDPDPSELRHLWYRCTKMHPEPGVNCSLLQHLFNIMPLGCSFVGDLMSIALNTSSIPLAFIGKADTTDEAIWIFSLLVLAANDAVPLTVGGYRRRLPGGVLSWFPSAIQGLLPSPLHFPDPSVISSVAMEYIELDLLVFRTIPVAPTNSSLEKAVALVRKFNLKELAKQYVAEDHRNIPFHLGICGLATDKLRRGTTPKPMDVFIETWLAHGVDCGPAWMARFPETIRRATENGFHAYGVTGIATDDRLLPAARALSAMVMAITSPIAARTQRGAAGQDDDNVRALSRFLRTVLDPRLKFFVSQPRRLAVSADDHAIIGQTSNITYVAVPLALAYGPAKENRAWVIEPFDPATENHFPEQFEEYLPDPARARIEPGEKVEDVFPLLTSDFEDRRRPRDDSRATWRVRKRCEIFGCQDFGPVISRLATAAAGEGVRGEGNDNLVLLRKQKVYSAEDHHWNAVYEATQRIEGGLGECPIGKVVGRAGAGQQKGFFGRLLGKISGHQTSR